MLKTERTLVYAYIYIYIGGLGMREVNGYTYGICFFIIRTYPPCGMTV
jgi:hypothetical protein